MNIVSVTASFEREEITTDTLNLLKNQKHLTQSILVGNDPDTKRAAERTGAMWIPCKNSPLGAKWQKGFTAARGLNPDAVLICGSDDWLTPNWCEVCAEEIARGYDLVGKTIWCVAKMIPGNPLELYRVQYEKRKDPIGSGRLISKRVLDKLGWNLFPNNKDRYLDWAAWVNIRAVGGELRLLDEREDVWLVCIKSTWETKSTWILKPKNAGCGWGEVRDGLNWLQGHLPDAPVEKYTKVT